MSQNENVYNFDWEKVPARLKSEAAALMAAVAEWGLAQVGDYEVDDTNDMAWWPTVDTEFMVTDGDDLTTLRIRVTDSNDDLRGAVKTLLDDFAWEGDLAVARDVANLWLDTTDR